MLAAAPRDAALVAFSCVASLDSDPMTRAFRSRIREWHDVQSMTDDALAAFIRAKRIDVLLDLAGHTSGNRLGVVAAAPLGDHPLDHFG
mgnify:CR=1 FL=1